MPPTMGRRVWKGFGGTPWWRLVLGGLIVLIAVAMLTVPFDAIRLQQRLKSPAEKQAFKLAVQRQVLDRARFGVIGFRTLLNDPVAAKEIGDAIGDIERELATPKHDVVVKNATELKVLIDTQKDEIRKTARAIDQFVAKPRATVSVAVSGNASATATAIAPETDSEANLELLSNKVERLQESVQQLQEMQSRKGEFDEAAEAGEPNKTITVSLFGTRAQAVINVADRVDPALAATPIDASTRDFINITVDRDANKMIVGSISFLALLTLFLLMLIARGFASRAARGEQRAVIAESRERSESYARQLAEARLMVMRAQVEPHFLFNTLAHVQALQEIDPPQAGVMMERLISYLRAAMPTMRETTSTLGREIEVVRAYLDLLKIRMGDRLRYVINVPADLNLVALPPTMIATLVENAIKHGLEPKKEGGTIAINARILPGVNGAADQLEILVADDGLGLGGAQTQGTGIGLANTRERLKMLYGNTGRLMVEPNAPSGVRALLTVPTQVPEVIEEMSEAEQLASGVSPFTMQTVGLLALFVGWLGVHRFYVGRMRSGAVQTLLGTLSILSGGVPVFVVPLAMWVILDVVWIVTREFRDRQGRRIARINSLDRRAYTGGGMPHASGRERAGEVSHRSRAIALILTILLGLAGAHRFYLGRTSTALAMLFTLGGLGIWWLIDIVLVASGQLKDNEGKWVSEWE